MQLRPYQNECVNAVWENLQTHTVFCISTGGGKSIIQAELIRRFLEYPGTTILMLAPRRELIKQNVTHLVGHLPASVEIGVYCAGLRFKQIKQVTVATIQSISNAKDLPSFDIIMIDECHGVPHEQDGLYHKLFARLPNARIIGCTATPYRMNGGLLHKGKDRLFETLCYETKVSELIRDGYLSPIRARVVSETADLSEVHTRGGEFIPCEMAAAMDKENLTRAAVNDVLNHASDRKSILVFASGVEHAKHIEQMFRASGQNSIAVVTEKTSSHDRENIVDAFKSKTTRIIVNCMVFTVGFDAPGCDCIVVLRASKSASLWVQIVGRGLRKSPDKKDCLVLDYGEHVSRFGPLDMITAESVTSGAGVAPTKTCPQCSSIIFAGFKVCPDCGYVFPENEKSAEKHGTTASDLDPISPTIIEEYDVKDVFYTRHEKHGKPPSLKVSYKIGLWKDISEYICVQHLGFAQQNAQAWFARRGVVPMPKTVDDALRITAELPIPVKIHVRKNGKYDQIIRYEWNTPPPR